MANSHDPLTVAIPPLGSQSSALASPSSIGVGKLSMHSRHHSLGTNPSMHRVTRRKSVSSNSTNLAAVAQAVKEGSDVQLTLPPPGASVLSRSVGRSVGMGLNNGLHSPNGSLAPLHGYPSPPSSLPNNGGTSPLLGAGSLPAPGLTFPRKAPVPGSPAPVNGGISNAAASSSSTTPSSANKRVRRASEGAHVLLGGENPEEKSRSKGGIELKCDKCGKGYKHSSCLTKHLWEHTPEWSLTSKLLISKHQQVQLLEAASILVSMNPSPAVDDINGNPTPAISTSSSGASINDNSSVSSGSEDTPPPTDHHSSSASVVDMESGSPLPPRVRPRSGSKRYTTSNRVERPSHGVYGSYHHSVAPPSIAGSVPTHVNPGSSFPSHFGNRQHVARPRAGSFVNSSKVASAAAAAADDEGLAAAVELLSCSFGAAPSGSTPMTPRGILGSPMTPHGNFIHQLREQARTHNMAGDVVMKIEETEEESVYYDGGMSHRNPSQQSADDEMAIDDEDEEDEWEGRRGSDGRIHTRAMIRRRRKSEDEEDGVFGKMEE